MSNADTWYSIVVPNHHFANSTGRRIRRLTPAYHPTLMLPSPAKQSRIERERIHRFEHHLPCADMRGID